MTPQFWSGKNVLLTGHTGFKGSWMSLWLQQLGANVAGFSDGVPTTPSLYEAAGVAANMTSITGDVRDPGAVARATAETQPDIVIHMAAQSLVRPSYEDPVATYATNVLGTVHVLEAARQVDTIRAVIIVTSDKCYENHERDDGYAEDHPMGGYDPYSSSKACAELVTSAYRNSFFNRDRYADHRVAVSSVRSGNVIGGGDWSRDRLIPDIVAVLRERGIPELRNPAAVRPWQFVLDPLHGYLSLAERLVEDGPDYAEAWNFGPEDGHARNVGYVAERLSTLWGCDAAWRKDDASQPHETTLLNLDSSKARSRLSWAPQVDLDTTLQWIVEWYRKFDAGEAREATLSQLHRYQEMCA